MDRSSSADASEEHPVENVDYQETVTNSEQQQGLLMSTTQERQYPVQPWWQRTLCKGSTQAIWIVVAVLLISGGIGIARIPRHKSNQADGNLAENEEAAWEQDDAMDNHKAHMDSQGQLNLEKDQSKRYIKTKQDSRIPSSIRQRSVSPEAVGHVNIYISEPVQHGDRGSPPRRIRFPVARYNRRRFPLMGPFLNFKPWIPIVADRLTRQTIIYSSSGVYILPPLINARGKLYSVAELMASGYASLSSTGGQPGGYFDMKPFVQSRPILGPDLPSISVSTGGFQGSVRTDFGSFSTRTDPRQDENNRDSDDEDRYNKNDRSPSYMPRRRHRYRQRFSRASATTRLTPTQNSTRSASITTAPPRTDPVEIHQTLIIDRIFPYSRSRKPIISANYSFPGPVLEAYVGDTFVIRVINRLDEPTTMHWHGIRQLGTPDMDGAVGVTQCAIPSKHEMIYTFKADPPGTLWYHGHLLEQYTDGLYGPLIIRRRNDPKPQLYDSEHILMVADWYNNRAHSELLPWYINPNNPDGNEPTPDAIVVNGKFTQSLFISLSGSRRVRFRIINSASFSMYTVSIDGLPLHVIEVDSTDTLPYTVNSVNINVAQRVSFYVDLNELDPMYTSTGNSSTNSLFIRFQAMLSMYPVDIVNYIPPYADQRYPYPTFFNPLYLGIVSFDSSNSTPTYPASQAIPTLSSSPTPTDTNLLDARPSDENQTTIPNATHSLTVLVAFDLGSDGINRPYINNVTYSSDANYMRLRPPPSDGITSDLYSPLLHQMAEKPQRLNIPQPVRNGGSALSVIQSDQNGHYLVPNRAVVDIFINNTDGGEHPFHLHSHTFWILSTSDYPEAESLYAGRYLSRDTVSVPALGWAKIRFLADNPGAWFFHCHIEWHMSAGLALVFLVSPEQLLANGYTVSPSQKQLCEALRRASGSAAYLK